MSEVRKPYPDPLIRQRLFPDPAQVFDFVPTGLKAALDNGIVVVDTNVLLIPYTTGRASLEQIRRTYERLTSSGRLRVPGQVAREFADNRAEKLKTLFQQLSRKRDVNLVGSEYPLLEGIPAYSDVSKRETKIISALAEYRKAVGRLLDTVAGWHWDDPVSQIYREFFKPPVIVDPEIDREELLKELRFRQEHRIPPGYKDANNEYSGVGDLLIWKTLLKIGQQESCHLVFVSGDEKTDWRYQSENTALCPRFELLDEYRIASKGKSLLIISFAELLQQFGAPAPVVAEVRQEEAVAALAMRTVPNYSGSGRQAQEAEAAVLRWLSTKYPDSPIEVPPHGAPDFIVRADSGDEGYEVMHVRWADIGKLRRLRGLIGHLDGREGSLNMPVKIVIVTDAGSESRLKQLFGKSHLTANFVTAVTVLILGSLNREGIFEERIRIRLRPPRRQNPDYAE